ncbi:hypothetical protein [Oceanirhabdus sp. W0125-5]|uniref:hypothetical protein n=1 Tax=Oceanirhabdus sp. W0125-5 TaxID=2999116 RepID=UPI0022F344D7|nr:hypothetical protein [Oceanirhabdus sp. W0125-5]WBW97366.1 hypothetical protein OW730_00495 [Oceanirhabdus sp. W0125-5]
MKKSNKKELIALGILGIASVALGMYLSKKENREKIKEELSKTNEVFKNKLDEIDYKYNIIPCNEVYQWNSDEDTINVTIHKEAKVIDE